MAADDVTNVNFGFKQFVTAVAPVGIYAAINKSFMTMDNISIMCRKLRTSSVSSHVRRRGKEYENQLYRYNNYCQPFSWCTHL